MTAPFALAIILGSAINAVIGLLLVRRIVPLQELEANHVVGGIIYALIGTSYAVLLSFVIVISWSELSNAEQAVAREAADLGTLYWLVHNFPADQRERVRDSISKYAESVINEEWPLMARGQSSGNTWQLHDELWRDVFALRPQTDDDQQRLGAQYSQALSNM